MMISFTLNGVSRTIDVSPTRRFVDVLRDDLGLTGTKVSCEIGRCGACTVLLNAQPVNACLLMAYQVEGTSILTIEGLAEEGKQISAPAEARSEPIGVSTAASTSNLHPLQRAFLEAGGFQCGYCTPGMILAAKALLDGSPNPTETEIRDALSGNLCRCTGYTGIFRAIEMVVNGGHAKPESAIDMEGEDVL